jgi:hypothetical protein
MRARWMWVSWVCAGCEGPGFVSGASEPIQVRGGTFRDGALPVDPEATDPTVLNVGGVGSVVTQGNGNIAYTGLATPDAWAVAIGFGSLGSGHWVVPVDGPDVTLDNNQLFDFVLDFTPEVPPGFQTIEVVAIAADNQPGPLYETRVCVVTDAASNTLTACNPESPPPNAVVSLEWNTNVDLDLLVLTPDGKLVTPKAPTTAWTEGGVVPSEDVADPQVGRISRDSNADCRIDGIRVESLVFEGEPPPGEYRFYASLSRTCGEPSVTWQLSLTQRVDAGDGNHDVQRTLLARGALLPVHADGGASLGTFITALPLP